jgi:hypothetical protein
VTTSNCKLLVEPKTKLKLLTTCLLFIFEETLMKLLRDASSAFP